MQKNEQTSTRPLWAPWRIDYITSPKSKQCVFCQIAKNKNTPITDEYVIHYGKTIFVVLNRYPYTSGHLLVIPYQHKNDLTILSNKEQLEMMQTIAKAQTILRQTMNVQGFNIGFNIGEAAGAGIAAHLHAHIVPRWSGDRNFMPILANQNVISQALADTAKLLKDGWNTKK